MKSRTPRMIDLTGHLKDLRGSLSPDCRHFTPAPPLYVCQRQADDTPRWALRLLLALHALMAALFLYHWLAR